MADDIVVAEPIPEPAADDHRAGGVEPVQLRVGLAFGRLAQATRTWARAGALIVERLDLRNAAQKGCQTCARC
jgi:hypothetical protein